MYELLHYHWQLIGDPTALGWTTFLAYLLAAMACWRAAKFGNARSLQTQTSATPGSDGLRTLCWWWLGVGILMFLLGLNKQLDLQTFLTEVGKIMARDQGWYEGRRHVQVLFVGMLAIVLGVISVLAAYALRPVLSHVLPALVGLVLIFIFVIFRAMVFHVLRVGSDAEPLTYSWVLELTGIGLVGWNALRNPQSIEMGSS